MNKKLLIYGAIILVIVLIYGYKKGWFGMKSTTSTPSGSRFMGAVIHSGPPSLKNCGDAEGLGCNYDGQGAGTGTWKTVTDSYGVSSCVCQAKSSLTAVPKVSVVS